MLPPEMKTISIPVNNRPDLLARVLDSISQAENSDQWSVVVSGEPSAVVSRPVRCKHIIVSHNAVRMGCWVNTFLAANLAMAVGSELNLYLEDDYLITPDTLRLCEQWNESDCDGLLCLRRPVASEDKAKPSDVGRFQGGLFGCGFAWRKRTWNAVRAAWFCNRPDGSLMWDWSMEFGVRDVPQWRPLVNRSHGIGLYGTHTQGSVDMNLFGSAYSGEPISQFNFVK